VWDDDTPPLKAAWYCALNRALERRLPFAHLCCVLVCAARSVLCSRVAVVPILSHSPQVLQSRGRQQPAAPLDRTRGRGHAHGLLPRGAGRDGRPASGYHGHHRGYHRVCRRRASAHCMLLTVTPVTGLCCIKCDFFVLFLVCCLVYPRHRQASNRSVPHTSRLPPSFRGPSLHACMTVLTPGHRRRVVGALQRRQPGQRMGPRATAPARHGAAGIGRVCRLPRPSGGRGAPGRRERDAVCCLCPIESLDSFDSLEPLEPLKSLFAPSCIESPKTAPILHCALTGSAWNGKPLLLAGNRRLSHLWCPRCPRAPRPPPVTAAWWRRRSRALSPPHPWSIRRAPRLSELGRNPSRRESSGRRPRRKRRPSPSGGAAVCAASSTCCWLAGRRLFYCNLYNFF
jgi:hypothetical protein